LAGWYTARMDDCRGPLPPHAQEGLRRFNAGEYFKCHEALELAWREETDPIRDLYRGILQAAVTYLHMQRGNYAGALKVSGRCMKWLDRWPDTCRGVNVAKLRADLSRAVEAWQRLGAEHVHEMDWSLLKPVEWNG
jgi:predicted metal-dependent hydrolase